MKLVLTGIQGAGKSTQGNLLSGQLNLPYLSTGHIFRNLAKERSKLGRHIKEVINSGGLISDEQAINIVNEYLDRPEYLNGFILDGFPRTLEQAKNFKHNLDKIIYLEIPDKEALWRLIHRGEEGRTDDHSVEAIKNRIALFHTYTKPVIDYYQKLGKVLIVDSLKDIESVNQEILKNLGKQLIDNKVSNWKAKSKIIIILVGLHGSGKTEAADYLTKQKKIPSLSFGKIVNQYIAEQGLPNIEEVHKRVRLEFREKYGQEAMAVLNKEKIKQALQESNVVLIEGLRSWQELIYLQENFPKVKIVTVGIIADKQVRYKRVEQRATGRNQLRGPERDLNEILDLNMGPTIAYADYFIYNNGSLDSFYSQIEAIYRKIYFGLA